jgi:uncharacterized protein UPF0182
MTIGITGPEQKVPRRSAVVGFIIAAVVVGIFLILLGLASDFLVDWLWFSSIGYLQVFWTTIGAKAGVLFAVWTGTAVILWLNGWLAVRFARRRSTQSVSTFVWNLAGNVPPPDLFAVVRDRLPWPRVIAGGAGLLALLVAALEVAADRMLLPIRDSHDRGDRCTRRTASPMLCTRSQYIEDIERRCFVCAPTDFRRVSFQALERPFSE